MMGKVRIHKGDGLYGCSLCSTYEALNVSPSTAGSPSSVRMG